MTERTREQILEDLAAKIRRRALIGVPGPDQFGSKQPELNQDNPTPGQRSAADSQQQAQNNQSSSKKRGRKPKNKTINSALEDTTQNNSDKNNQKQKDNQNQQQVKPKDKIVKVKCGNPNCPRPGGFFETTEELYLKMKKYCSDECRKEVKRIKERKSNKTKSEEPLVSLSKEQSKKQQTATEEVTIPYEPHDGGQREIHNDYHIRFRVINAGTRWGKDRCSINEFIRLFVTMLSENRDDSLVPRVHGWLVAPTFPLARQLWRELKYFFPAQWEVNKNEAERQLTTVMDGLIEVKSADDPDSLVSVGLDIVLLTEAARVRDLETTWGYLRGRLSSPGRGLNGQGGMALINSTPKGRNFFYTMYCWGMDERLTEWKSYHHPTSDNPYINPKEIEEARRTLPERVFRQEFLAEFLEDSGEVFANVDEISTGVIQEPEPGRTYKAAWDPAQRNDYSAFGIRDDRGVQVVCERWTGLPWTMQLDRVEYYCKRYNNAPLDMDSTGLGETLPEAAAQRGIPVTGHFFTNAFKEQLVSHLSLLCESRDIVLINDKHQKEELKAYTYSFTKTGKISYHHPVGGHDDLVTMLMLLYMDYNATVTTLPYMGILLGGNRWKTA